MGCEGQRARDTTVVSFNTRSVRLYDAQTGAYRRDLVPPEAGLADPVYLAFKEAPPPPPIAIASFSPAIASYLGKTAFTVRGSNFTTASEVVIDGARIRPRFVDGSTLEGSLPPHAPTTAPLAVAVDDPVRGRAVLAGALSYDGPL